MTTRKPSKGRRGSSPLCLRVTPDERQILETRARDGRHASVSAYMRARLFGGVAADADVSGAGSNGRISVADRQKLLAQILGALGESKALRNLSDLADAARIGVLPLTPEVTAEIRAACAGIVELRALLIRALGVRPPKETGHDP